MLMAALLVDGLAPDDVADQAGDAILDRGAVSILSPESPLGCVSWL